VKVVSLQKTYAYSKGDLSNSQTAISLIQALHDVTKQNTLSIAINGKACWLLTSTLERLNRHVVQAGHLPLVKYPKAACCTSRMSWGSRVKWHSQTSCKKLALVKRWEAASHQEHDCWSVIRDNSIKSGFWLSNGCRARGIL
jgi:hypothetical protein